MNWDNITPVVEDEEYQDFLQFLEIVRPVVEQSSERETAEEIDQDIDNFLTLVVQWNPDERLRAFFARNKGNIESHPRFLSARAKYHQGALVMHKTMLSEARRRANEASTEVGVHTAMAVYHGFHKGEEHKTKMNEHRQLLRQAISEKNAARQDIIHHEGELSKHNEKLNYYRKLSDSIR